MHLLANGGLIPQYVADEDQKLSSPRRRGVKQGATMFLLAILLVPVFGAFATFAPGRLGDAFEFFAILSAIIGFLGGALRMLYAGIFEEGAPKAQFMMSNPYAPPVLAAPQARVSLPPAAVNPGAASWRQRPQTAEIQQPPSVTDNTTRLLDKKEPETK